MKKPSASMKELLVMYEKMNINPKGSSICAEIVLRHYRRLIWVSKNRATDVYGEASEISASLHTTITSFIDCAPDMMKDRLEDKIYSLFTTSEMVSALDMAMARLGAFPINGKEYQDLLKRLYMTPEKLRVEAIAEVTQCTRSVIYQRRTEAIYAYGLILFGYIVPDMQMILAAIA